MRSKEVPAQAVNVKEAVILSTTCTSDTVSQLNSYLFPESSVKPTSDISRTAIIQLPKSRQAQPKRNARARKRPEVTIHETPEADLNPITSTDQGKLATEIINAVLQSFTESVKARSPAQGSCKEKMSHHTTSPNSTTLSPTERRCPEAPLQPLSVNIACSDKGQCKESRRSSRQTTCSDGIRAASGFAAQAECARLAFSALRALDARGALAKKLPFLRLENAMSTLVNKLIALELFEPAHRQLRVLRISLLVAAKGAEKTGSSTHGELGNKERITDLLSFPCASVKGPLLSMIVTFQFQVLRLIAAKRDGSLFRATWEHLQPANPHSPANLIQAQHDPADPGTSAKIANQLEALSRLVLSICPVVLSPEDKKSVRSETMDPLTALRLQILALEIRSLWWSIAGHKGDIAKELLVPFSQYLSTFRQRSAKHVEEGYGSAKSALASLALSAPDGDRFLNATTGFNEAWLSIFSDMSELCATVGLSNEGRDWLEKYTRVRMDNGASPCKRCTLTCKKAVLYAQVSASLSCDAELANAFREAGHLIEGSLDGSSEELDELLLVLIKLRKAAGVIINRSRIIPEKPEGPPESNLIRQCYSICSACVKFLSKYIGSRPSQSVDHRLNFRYQQRLKQALAVTTAFVQTVTSIARLTKADDPEEWVHTDSGLQACLLLATVTQEGHQDTEGNARDHHDTLNAFVSVSHAYWLRYSHLKLTDGDNREALKALKASINAVEHRPLACKIAAQLHLRFEHYANTLESVREHGKALEIYTKAARLHIEMGVLQKVATAAATQSPSMIFARHSDLSPWGRVLSAYITVAIRMETEMSATRMIYDDESLESIQRGIALEHQLYSLIAVLEKTPDPPLMSMAIQRLARDLLALYSEQAFPIRRLRVIVAILWLDSGRPKLFPPELMDALLEYKFDRATSKCHGADSGLQLLRPYLSASRDAVLAMQEECPIRKQQMLKSALATWYLLIEESLDLNALEARVGDPAPWLLHLELLARYLEAYGLGLLRQSVLQLITTLREKFFPTQDKELMLNLVQSGLQYSRLGFFQHAGLAFHKVQKYFDKGEDFGEAAVWFYVAYAEYFLMIGSFGKCREHLERAQRVFESHEHDHARGIAAINRKKLPHLMADVASLHSDFAARCGNTSRALLLARQSLKLVLRAWASIERRQKSSKIDNGDMDGNSGVGGLVDSISKTTVADHDSIKNGRTVDRKGSAYWPVVPQLHKALLQVSQLYANEGLFGEASYYSEQSRKLVESASAQSLAVRSISHQADLLTRRGNYVEADIKIAFASRQFELLEEDQYLLQFQLNLIHYHLVKGQSPAAEDICLAAKSLLQHLTHSDRTRRDLHDQHDIFALQAQLSQLTLRADELRAPDPKRRAPTKTAAKRSGPVGKGTKTQVASSSDKETLSLALYQMRCKVIRQQTMLAVRKGNFDEAKLLLDEASKYYRTLEDTVLHAMLNSEVYFNRGLEGLSGDPVYCVLRESTISFPSVVSRPPPKPITPSKACSAKACGNLAKRGTVGADSKRVRTAPQADGDRPGHDFQKAMVELGKVYQRAKSVCPTAALHDLSKIMAEIIVKLSALNLANFEQGFKGSPSTLLGIIGLYTTISSYAQANDLDRYGEIRVRIEGPICGASRRRAAHRTESADLAKCQCRRHQASEHSRRGAGSHCRSGAIPPFGAPHLAGLEYITRPLEARNPGFQNTLWSRAFRSCVATGQT